MKLKQVHTLLALALLGSVSSALAQAPAQRQSRYYVARLPEQSSLQLRATLTAAGFRELTILPGRRVLVERVASVAAAPAQGLETTIELEPLQPAERMSRELLQLTAADGEVPVLIHAMPGVGGASAQAILTAAGLPVLGASSAGGSARVATLLPGARAAELTAQLGGSDEIMFVERIHHLGLFNDRSAGTVQSGMQGATEAATPLWAHGLHGEGQVVGILDTGVDPDSCYFSGPDEQLPKFNTWSASAGYGQEIGATHSKIVAYDFLYSCDQFASERDCDAPMQSRAWESNGHGTHGAGSMVGQRAGGTGDMNNGMAPAAKLVVQDAGYKVNPCADLPGLGCPVVDTYPLFGQAYAQGARIHNNSYGDNEDAPTPESSNYSARTQDVDRFMWDHKDMLIVHAAGNEGAGNRDFSVSSPSTNKNGLSVGSVRNNASPDNDNDISSFSSRGWTADGRIKPDLMAPGCNTSAGSDNDNTTKNCSTNAGCGTSYAAPIVVGAAALVRQYLTDGFYPSGAKNPADALQPTAAVIKALLLNSAVSMTGRDNAGQAITPIPSNEQGWGRIQLDRALPFTGATRKLYLDDHKLGFAAGDSAGASVEYTLSGVDPAEPLKVTLVWTDYPGRVDSGPAAPKLDDPTSLNAAQLVNDLDLSLSQGAETYLGNAFSEGASITGGSADRRNNVEQVLLAQPSAGTWTLRVVPHSIMQAGQDFALVITGKWESAGPAAGQPPSAAGSGGQGGNASAGGAGEAAAGSGAPAAGNGEPTAGRQASAAGNGAPAAGKSGSAAGGSGGRAASPTTRAGAPAAGSGTAGVTALSQAATQSYAGTPRDQGGCGVAAGPHTQRMEWLLFAGVAVWLVRRRGTAPERAVRPPIVRKYP